MIFLFNLVFILFSFWFFRVSFNNFLDKYHHFFFLQNWTNRKIIWILKALRCDFISVIIRNHSSDCKTLTRFLDLKKQSKFYVKNWSLFDFPYDAEYRCTIIYNLKLKYLFFDPSTFISGYFIWVISGNVWNSLV